MNLRKLCYSGVVVSRDHLRIVVDVGAAIDSIVHGSQSLIGKKGPFAHLASTLRTIIYACILYVNQLEKNMWLTS